MPHSLFSGIISAEIVDMYKQRIWYKLPYEDMSDLKVLCDGDTNFQNLCRTAPWNKLIELYMEHENAHSEDEEDANRGCENEAESNQEKKWSRTCGSNGC